MCAEWEKALEGHPDQQLREYLITGFKEGFRVGFNPNQPLQSTAKNMQSATLNPEPVVKYLETELQANRVLGPLHPSQVAGVHISRFGVIPKKGNGASSWTCRTLPPRVSTTE